MLKDRLDNYKKLEELRESKLITYVTSDRQGMETQLASDVLPLIINHLDIIGDVNKISLLLYTRGGMTMAAWSLVNLIRTFCKNFEVIVPFNCHSAGTLICLGANNIVMTKQATLGPIDPSINSHFNPVVNINGQNITVPVSVEQVNAYLKAPKKELGIKNRGHLKDIYVQLLDKLHPLCLGEVYRAMDQIPMLARKLLRYQTLSKEKVNKIIKFLCSESGSHDYTINRREAKEELGLNIEKPNDELYSVINAAYKNIEEELELLTPFIPNVLLAVKNPHKYNFRRGLLESVDGGCDVFVSEGTLTMGANAQGQTVTQDERIVEGWSHEKM